MKKKLVSIILAAALICSSPTLVFADEKDDRIKELETQVEQMQKTIDELQEKLSKYEINSSGIEEYLLEKGVLSGDRVEMAAEMLGAIAGFKYEDAEIYEYDTNSEEYLKLSSGESIPLQGVDGITLGALAVNGKYVLMGEASDELISAFKEFK